MEGATGAEFQDWQVLHDLNSKGVVTLSEFSGEKSSSFDGIEGDSDSEGIIKSDYFSLANEGRHVKTIAERDLSEEGSVESDNPSWIDSGLANRYGLTNSGEFLSDSGSDKSNERKFNEFDSKTGSGLAENEQSRIGDGELGAESQKLESLKSHESSIRVFDPKSEMVFAERARNHLDFEDFDEIQSQSHSKELSSFWSESGGDELVLAKFGDVGDESEMGLGNLLDQSGSNVKLEGVDDEPSDENKNLPMEEAKVNTKFGGGDEEKRKVVWWKVPFEVLKYCMFKASPVWSLSVAATVMGFLILGRKLYKMKRKSQGLQLKVAVDDKKVSQFMSRAARLNEAFSVVRRVPMVQPALRPAAGINPWPAMSMR